MALLSGSFSCMDRLTEIGGS